MSTANLTESFWTCRKRWDLERELRKTGFKPTTQLRSERPHSGAECAAILLAFLDSRDDPNGGMSDLSPDRIEQIARWGGKKGELFKALVVAGFIDSPGTEDQRWHDYKHFNGKRVQSRIRQRNKRDKERDAKRDKRKSVTRSVGPRSESPPLKGRREPASSAPLGGRSSVSLAAECDLCDFRQSGPSPAALEVFNGMSLCGVCYDRTVPEDQRPGYSRPSSCPSCFGITGKVDECGACGGTGLAEATTPNPNGATP